MFILFCLIVKYPWYLNQLSLNCGIVPGSGQTNDDVKGNTVQGQWLVTPNPGTINTRPPLFQIMAYRLNRHQAIIWTNSGIMLIWPLVIPTH